MATILSFSDYPSPDIIAAATHCIQQEGVISVATESFYALAAGVEHQTAIQRVVNMKRDRQGKPILLLIGEKTQVTPLINRTPPGADVLIDRFWPGPLTLVFPAAPHLPDSLTCGTGTVGIRQPQSTGLLALLRSTGPITGTSANRSGENPLQNSSEVEAVFGNVLDLILDSGISPGGRPSTILSLVGEIRLLREGPVSFQAIQEVLSTVGLAGVDSVEKKR